MKTLTSYGYCAWEKIMTIMFLFLVVNSLIIHSEAQTISKTVVDLCDLNDPRSCGTGRCFHRATGNRCQCPSGLMGRGCARPCQDVYKSCTKWKEEDRCAWASHISPFFTDNCAFSCGVCQGNGKKLLIALPPILEPISWFVGRWETKTSSTQRFPEEMSGPYREILDVQISEVPMFDRPPVNISVTATTLDGQDVHRDLGFLTGKPFNEDTGFLDKNKPSTGDDRVAIEMVSNTGLLTIEEGIVRGQMLRLETKYTRHILGEFRGFQSAKRMFTLVAPNLLEERTIYKDRFGQTKKWLKRYRRTFDYLNDLHEQ